MEEKERYEVISNKKNFIEIQDIERNVDTFITEDTIEDLLNQQSNRIKELEQENQQLKQQLAEKDKEIEKLNACVKFYKSYYISFNEKVIAELEKVKSAFGLINSKLDKVETIKEYIHYIDHQIKQLKEMK